MFRIETELYGLCMEPRAEIMKTETDARVNVSMDDKRWAKSYPNFIEAIAEASTIGLLNATDDVDAAALLLVEDAPQILRIVPRREVIPEELIEHGFRRVAA